MSKEFECLDRIDKRNYLTEREHKEFLGVVEKALTEYEAIKNAEPSKALKDVEELKELVEMNKKMKYKNIFTFNLDIIKQALIERIVWKNIHNTKVKIPLCDVFNNPTLLSKEERYKYIEHIYYHWEEMKEALEDKNSELEKENAELKAKAQEPKKYLKWGDLEFKETHKIKILMNGNLYNLLCYDEKYIEIRTIKGEYMLTLDNDNSEEKQFFNDLHLEVIEE